MNRFIVFLLTYILCKRCSRLQSGCEASRRAQKVPEQENWMVQNKINKTFNSVHTVSRRQRRRCTSCLFSRTGEPTSVALCPSGFETERKRCEWTRTTHSQQRQEMHTEAMSPCGVLDLTWEQHFRLVTLDLNKFRGCLRRVI